MSEAVKIPDFLKSLPAAASLLNLSILCATSSGELRRNTTVIPTPTTPICADMNEAEEGFMRTSMETLNRPMNGIGGFVLTLRYDAVAKTQIFFGWTHARLFMRRRNSSPGDNSWDVWKEIAFVS